MDVDAGEFDYTPVRERPQTTPSHRKRRQPAAEQTPSAGEEDPDWEPPPSSARKKAREVAQAHPPPTGAGPSPVVAHRDGVVRGAVIDLTREDTPDRERRAGRRQPQGEPPASPSAAARDAGEGADERLSRLHRLLRQPPFSQLRPELLSRAGDIPLDSPDWAGGPEDRSMPPGTGLMVEAIVAVHPGPGPGSHSFLVKWRGYQLHPAGWVPQDELPTPEARERAEQFRTDAVYNWSTA